MKGECPTCHRPPDFTNVGVCPNCGRFDWVLVEHIPAAAGSYRILWACPCGEFKWTSYAEWKAAKESVPETEPMPASQVMQTQDAIRDAAIGGGDHPPRHMGKPGAFEAHTT